MSIEPPVVTIRCFAYNHEPFIRQCLEGFVMQKTNFRFEAIVHDDASMDGTGDIIREYAKRYPDIIIPIIEEENQYSKGDGSISRILSPYMRGKYIAYCEGDDYWIDPLKLQKQVDFMDSHPDYGLCHTDFITTGRRQITPIRTVPDDNYWPEILTHGLRIGACTVLMRASIYNEIPLLNLGKGWPIGDLPMWFEFARVSKIKYLSDVTATYRVLDESASHSKSLDKVLNYEEKKLELKRFYAKTYDVEVDETIWLVQFHENIIRYAARTKQRIVAKKYYTEAKEKSIVSRKMQVYYYASRCLIIRWILQIMHLL